MELKESRANIAKLEKLKPQRKKLKAKQKAPTPKPTELKQPSSKFQTEQKNKNKVSSNAINTSDKKQKRCLKQNIVTLSAVMSEKTSLIVEDIDMDFVINTKAEEVAKKLSSKSELEMIAAKEISLSDNNVDLSKGKIHIEMFVGKDYKGKELLVLHRAKSGDEIIFGTVGKNGVLGIDVSNLCPFYIYKLLREGRIDVIRDPEKLEAYKQEVEKTYGKSVANMKVTVRKKFFKRHNTVPCQDNGSSKQPSERNDDTAQHKKAKSSKHLKEQNAIRESSQESDQRNVVNAKQIDTDGIRPPSDIRKNHKESSIGFLKEYKLIDYTILVFGAIIILILLFYVFVFIMEIKIRKENRTRAQSDEDTF